MTARLAMNASGQFVAGVSARETYVRAYDASGAAQSDLIYVGDNASNLSLGASSDFGLAIDTAGSFTIGFKELAPNNLSGRPTVFQFDATGTPLGPGIVVSNTPSAILTASTLAMNDSGEMVMVWLEYFGYLQTTIFARRLFTPTSTIAGRELFYNHSTFDDNEPESTAGDDAAIATDKLAYLPDSGIATFANVSSSPNGINGIMIDLAGTHGTITIDDLMFKVGSDNDPTGWQVAPAPDSMTLRPGAGTSGSDRLQLVWNDGDITNTWLEVTIAAGPNTGLAAPDVFYFGSRIGDTGVGNPSMAAISNAFDQFAVRANGLVGAAITNPFDLNRDGMVNATDEIISRNNPGLLPMIDIGGAVPLATGDDASQAVASALATRLSARQTLRHPVGSHSSVRTVETATPAPTATVAASVQESPGDTAIVHVAESVLDVSTTDLDELLDTLLP